MGSESWDFYFTEIDGCPASISVDFAYESEAERRGYDTFAVVTIGMLDLDQHGMGSAAEAAVLWPIENEIAAAGASAFLWVGRRRRAGMWELAYYGGPDVSARIQPIVEGLDRGERPAEIGSQSDPEWLFYTRDLLPSPERRHWIQNRNVVHSLEQQGDDLEATRAVDHFAYFPSAAARDAFAAEASSEGFRLDRTADDAGTPLPFAAHVAREDGIELESIHRVVMTLVGLAEQYHGTYDGWGTTIVKPKSGLLRRRR